MSVDLMNGFNKAFLVSVGAVATVAEKSSQVVNDFVEKGELTVAQGKALNAELTRKAKEAMNETTDNALRMHLESMSDEERASYAEKVAAMAADITAAKAAAEADMAADEADEVVDETADAE